MHRWKLNLLIVLTWLSLTPITASAQEIGVQVRVTDRQGAGVPNIEVILRDASGQTVLARGTTDARGAADFTVRETSVRLSLQGTTPGGLPVGLGHVSFLDDEALLVRTDVGGPLVSLVMDMDGQVYIDPASIEPEAAEGGAATLAASPTAADAEQTPTPTIEAPSAAAVPAAPATASIWPFLLIGAALTGVVIWFGMERRLP